MQLSKEIGQSAYANALSKNIDGLAVTKTNLRRLLQSIDQVGWSTNEESGRVDRKAFVRYATGSANIFSRRTSKQAETSAVSIFIDCSGSMNAVVQGSSRSRIDIARQITIHLTKILSQSRVPFAVTGFNTQHAKAGRNHEQSIGNAYAVSETPCFIPIKTWKQSLQSAIPKLGYIAQFADGGTPDYSAIFNAIDDLNQRPESKRILFLITDATGYHIEHIKHLQTLADKLGVLIVAIGIGTNDAIKCFTNAAAVNSAEDFASSAFNNVLRAIRQ